MNKYNQKHQQKSKSIPSAEQNYFVHFALRYPVSQTWKFLWVVKVSIYKNNESPQILVLSKMFLGAIA